MRDLVEAPLLGGHGRLDRVDRGTVLEIKLLVLVERHDAIVEPVRSTSSLVSETAISDVLQVLIFTVVEFIEQIVHDVFGLGDHLCLGAAGSGLFGARAQRTDRLDVGGNVSSLNK